MACLFGCEPAVRAPTFQLMQEDWKFHDVAGKRLRTDHFDMRITLKDEQLTDVLPVFLEACHRRYEEMAGRPPVGEQPLTTYVFETRQQWLQFTERFVPERAYIYRHIQNGGYTDQPTATAVLYFLGRDRTLAVAGHEGWHQYVARNFRSPIPAWLNEGLATQLEGFELRDGLPVFTPRKNYFRRNDLKNALIVREHALFKLPEFLGMNAGDVFDPADRKSAATYYAQVWSTVLFLLEGPNAAYREAFRSLMADAGTERLIDAVKGYRVATPAAAGMSMGEIVFRRYITEDLDAFFAEYTTFARDLVRGTPEPGRFPW